MDLFADGVGDQHVHGGECVCPVGVYPDTDLAGKSRGGRGDDSGGADGDSADPERGYGWELAFPGGDWNGLLPVLRNGDCHRATVSVCIRGICDYPGVDPGMEKRAEADSPVAFVPGAGDCIRIGISDFKRIIKIEHLMKQNEENT